MQVKSILTQTKTQKINLLRFYVEPLIKKDQAMPLKIEHSSQHEIKLHQFFEGLHQLMKTTLLAKDFLQIYDLKIRPLDFKGIMSEQKLVDADDDVMVYQELSPKYQVLKSLVSVEIIWFDSQHELHEITPIIHQTALPDLQQIVANITEKTPVILVSRPFDETNSFVKPQVFMDILTKISNASIDAALTAQNKQLRHNFNEPATLNEFIHLLDTPQIIQEILNNNHESPLLSQSMTDMYGFDASNNLSSYLQSIIQHDIIIPKKG